MWKMTKRILALLRRDERRKAVRVSVTILLNALLDFASIAALLPVLYFLLEDRSKTDAALLFCILAIGLSVLKFILSTIFSRYQQSFLLSLYKRMSFSLFSAYYGRGLEFIKSKGISKLGQEVNAVCYSFSQSILAPLLKTSGDMLLIFLAGISVFIYSPVTALIIALSFLPFALVYVFLVRKTIRDVGKREYEARKKQRGIVNETFGGYSEMEVYNAFPMYGRRFLEGMDEISESRLRLNTVQKVPLFLSELAVIAGLAILVIFGTGDAKLLVGVFAVAAFKILPAARSILSGWTVIRNSEYCVGILEEGLCGSRDFVCDPEPVDFLESLEFRKVTFSYADGSKVLDVFDMRIGRGEYVGLRGESGVGKTTVFNLLLGFLRPVRGEVLIDGEPLDEKRMRGWRDLVGYVPQDVFIFNASLAENISIGEDIDRERIKSVLKSLNLDSWACNLPEGIDTVLAERGESLSGGQRQRIGIARALYRNSRVLLLDEATSSLDNDTEMEYNRTLEALRKENPDLTVLSIAHRDSSLSYCDRIIEL